jgi:hypothetical protein
MAVDPSHSFLAASLRSLLKRVSRLEEALTLAETHCRQPASIARMLLRLEDLVPINVDKSVAFQFNVHAAEFIPFSSAHADAAADTQFAGFVRKLVDEMDNNACDCSHLNATNDVSPELFDTEVNELINDPTSSDAPVFTPFPNMAIDPIEPIPVDPLPIPNVPVSPCLRATSTSLSSTFSDQHMDEFNFCLVAYAANNVAKSKLLFDEVFDGIDDVPTPDDFLQISKEQNEYGEVETHVVDDAENVYGSEDVPLPDKFSQISKDVMHLPYEDDGEHYEPDIRVLSAEVLDNDAASFPPDDPAKVFDKEDIPFPDKFLHISKIGEDDGGQYEYNDSETHAIDADTHNFPPHQFIAPDQAGDHATSIDATRLEHVTSSLCATSTSLSSTSSCGRQTSQNIDGKQYDNDVETHAIDADTYTFSPHQLNVPDKAHDSMGSVDNEQDAASDNAVSDEVYSAGARLLAERLRLQLDAKPLDCRISSLRALLQNGAIVCRLANGAGCPVPEAQEVISDLFDIYYDEGNLNDLIDEDEIYSDESNTNDLTDEDMPDLVPVSHDGEYSSDSDAEAIEAGSRMYEAFCKLHESE